MAENIINLGFDINKFSAEKKIIYDGLMDIYNKGKAISETLIPVGSNGGFAELTKKVQDQAKAIDELQKANVKYAETQQQINTLNGQVAASTQSLAKATNIDTQSVTENVAARRRYLAEIDRLKAGQKQITDLYKSGNISQKEYNESINQSTAKIEVYKNKVSDLNSVIKTQTATAKQQGGAYAILNKQYLEAQTNAKNLAISLGVESKEAKAAAAAALDLGNKLKAADASVGQMQRNVGNYTNSINKAWGAVRTLAYALPGIGIAGLLSFAIDPIVDFVKWVTRASDATLTLAKNKQLINDIVEEGDKNASAEITDLKIAYDATQNITLSIRQRAEAAKYLQETYPATFKNFSTEKILLGEAKTAYDELTASILKQSIATAARGKLAELSNKELDVFIKYTERRKELEADIQKSRITKTDDQIAKENGLTTSTQIDRFKKNSAILADARRKQINDSVKDYEKGIKEIRDQQKLIIDFIGAGNLVDSLFKDDKSKSKGKSAVSSIKESTKELLDAEYELYRIAQNRKLALLDTELQDTKKNLGERLVLADMYNTEAIKLQEKTTQHEIDIDKLKLAELQNNFKQAKGTEKNNIEADIKNTNSKILIETAKGKDDLIALEISYQKRLSQIFSDEETKRLNDLKSAEDAIKLVRTTAQGAIEADAALRFAANDDALKKHLITEKQYALQKKKIENESLILSLTVQKKEAEGLMEVARLKGENLVQYENLIAQLTGKIKSAQLAGGDEDKKGSFKENADKFIKFETLAITTVQALVDAQHQRRIQQLEDESRMLDENHQKEINNIMASTLSEQEKAAMITQLEAKHAADKQAILNKEKQERRKQAEFDKAITIAQIVIQTALAVVKAAPNPYLMALAAATGVAELAVAVATPIPSYADGTDDHPGGLARYAEDGPEAIKEPGKPVRIVSRETIGELAKHTKVIPLKDSINTALYASMIQGTAAMMGAKEVDGLKEIREAIELSTDRTVQAFKKQKAIGVSVHIHSDWNTKINRDVRN